MCQVDHYLDCAMCQWLPQVNEVFAKNAIDAVMHFAAIAYVSESMADPLRWVCIPPLIMSIDAFLYNLIILQFKRNFGWGVGCFAYINTFHVR